MDLHKLRAEFDRVALEKRLSPDTLAIYRRWIRRNIEWCHKNGYGDQFTCNSVNTFLITKCLSESTQRQAYHAIKFLFLNLLKRKHFPKIQSNNGKRVNK